MGSNDSLGDWVRVGGTAFAVLFAGCVGGAPAQDGEVSVAALECVTEPGVAAESLASCIIPGTVGQHLAQVQRAHFDYDPPGLAVERVKGHYSRHRGAIDWRATPAADSYLNKVKAEGSVTRTADGALATYEVKVIEDNGAVQRTEVEETFQPVPLAEGEGTSQACLLTRRTRAAGGTELEWLTQQGTWDGATLSYTQERISRTYGGRIGLDGVLNADGSWSEYYEGSYGGADVYESWAGDADGNTAVGWEMNWGDDYVWGTDTRARDGSLHRYIRHVHEWCVPWEDLTLHYDGTGSGSASICVPIYYEEDGEVYEDIGYASCSLAIANGVCTETCDNGGVYSCNSLL